jgi:hypothetical protein
MPQDELAITCRRDAMAAASTCAEAPASVMLTTFSG